MSEDKKLQEKKGAAEEEAQIEDARVEAEAEIEAEGNTNTPLSAAAPKAGPKSRRAKVEAEQAEDKEQRAETEDKPKPSKRVIHTPNPRRHHGRRYLEAAAKVDREKTYELEEAIKLAKDTAKLKFDSSVELHLNLGVDPRQADQMVRSSVVLPHGTGKEVRITVIAPSDKHDAAKKAGADKVADDSLIDEIANGKLDFDILIATPDMMPKLSKVAKVLGPKGLMPTPKNGSVTANPADAIKQLKAGRVEFRIDRQGIIHQPVGKASFDAKDLLENVRTLVEAVVKARPAAAKGAYLKAATLTTSMGPGIKLDLAQLTARK